MNTPICDFVREYAAKEAIRAHMPGHKGRGDIFAVVPGDETKNQYDESFSRITRYDITEISGADDLYYPHGIIAESEANASEAFQCPTYYSTEGSSLCIRAMLYLAMMKQREDPSQSNARGSPPWVLATRNAHKSFASACILLGIDVEWLTSEKTDEEEEQVDYTSFKEKLPEAIGRHGCLPCCVYLTSPDYLGRFLDIEGISKLCHVRGVTVVVDNAHAAYSYFLSGPDYRYEDDMSPIAQGADMCCDSAHKTLPVLTGGAYLHVRKGFFLGNADYMPPYLRTTDVNTAYRQEENTRRVKEAMALFASTSPSWLILQSLDKQNPYLDGVFFRDLGETKMRIMSQKFILEKAGFELIGDDPLRITVRTRSWGYTGYEFAQILRDPTGIRTLEDENPDETESKERSEIRPIEVEFSDPDVVVLMFSVRNAFKEIDEAGDRILKIRRRLPLLPAPLLSSRLPEKVMTMREAALRPYEIVPVGEALGRIAHVMDVTCPPAVPIVFPGERIGEKEVERLCYYGYNECKVLRENVTK
ncbi:MAG: hypothetical protein IK020_12015 [Clostridiales bacterium]|nr:hypothetical protein [Clostridiales bacterium]